MVTSIFLAKVLGLYFLIISVCVLINKEKVIPVIGDIMSNASMRFILGFTIFIIGLLLVVSHNIWIIGWPIIITIISWIIFLKGIILIGFPEYAMRISNRFINQNVPPVPILVNLILGLFLCYEGFFANL